MSRLLVVVTLLLVAVGCSQRLGDLTVASNHNVVLSSFVPSGMTPTQAEGKHCVGVLLGMPLGTPNIEEAVDRALAAGGGNLLTDVVLRSTFWTAIVYGQNCIQCEGKVWSVQTAQLEGDWVDDLAAADPANQMEVRLSDGRTVQGWVLALDANRMAVRTAKGEKVLWVERAEIVGMSPIAEE